jgi:hypothetical protein
MKQRLVVLNNCGGREISGVRVAIPTGEPDVVNRDRKNEDKCKEYKNNFTSF